jgi:hypothetical protein
VEHDVHNDDDRSARGANAKEQFDYFERIDVERLDVEQPALATGATRRRLQGGDI